MSLRQRHPRIKLDFEDYAMLKKRVLERDSWRCQDCGSFEDLQIHHLKSSVAMTAVLTGAPPDGRATALECSC